MSEFFEKFLNGFQKTKKVVVEKSSVVIEKGNELAEMAKIKLAISKAESKIDDILLDIGRIVYEAYTSNDVNTDDLEEKCTEIDNLKKEIAAKKAQYAGLNKEKFCPECGAENAIGAQFCNQCSAKFEEEAAAEKKIVTAQVVENETAEASEE